MPSPEGQGRTGLAGPTWQDGVEDTENQGPQVEKLQTDASELRDAQPHKDVVGVEQTSQHLNERRVIWKRLSISFSDSSYIWITVLHLKGNFNQLCIISMWVVYANEQCLPNPNSCGLHPWSWDKTLYLRWAAPQKHRGKRFTTSLMRVDIF